MKEKHVRLIEEFCKKKEVSIENKILTNGKYPNQITYLKTKENKKTILLIHGLSCEKYSPFVELLIMLLREGYSVVIFDLPGHGKNKEPFSLEGCAKFVSRVISFLKKKVGVKKEDLILIGQSMGGFLALFESTKNSVGGIVTISAPIKVNPKSFVFLEFLSVINSNFLRQLKYYSFNHLTSFKVLKRKTYSKEKIAEMTEEAGKVSYKILENIKKSKVPLLQMHGRLDLFVPFPQAEAIYENYGGEKTKYFSFFSNHFSILFNKKSIGKILNWLKSVE